MGQVKNALFVEYGFNDVHPNGSQPENFDFWQGNALAWQKIMRGITISKIFFELASKF